jgi:NitT/TauT family transport system substrate-binding protein
MKRVARLATGALLVLALLPGCGSSSPTATPEPSVTPTPTVEATVEETPTPEPTAERTTFRVASLKGPTTMGLVSLMDDAATGEARHDYQVTMYGTPDEIVPQIVQGQIDVALVPANLAAVLYNRTLEDDAAQIQVVAINTLGVLEVVEAGETIQSVADLAGKTIYSTGKGATPEYVLNYLLTSNGLDPATDVTVEYRSEATEVAALLAAEPGAVGVLPQPYVTVLKTQNPDVRTALSFTEEWAKVATDSQLVTGVVVARTQFIEENPLAFEEFLADYQASTEFTNANPAEAAVLIAEAGIVPAAPVAEAAIPACNITYIDGAELQATLSGYLDVLFEADPASVGGSVPGDDFYYRR